MDNLLFAVVVLRLAHNSSVSNDRAPFCYLQAARLIQHHTGVLGTARLTELSIVITDRSEQCALGNHVARLCRRIPEAVLGCRLVADIGHFHRHVVPHIAADLIHAEAA